MSRKALILGGGVAGCSVAYFLGQKHYDVTIINEREQFGGLARTEKYAGHPYEFGPHIWFWPGGVQDPINAVINDLTDGELHVIDRKLFSYIEPDQKMYRYPIHFEDIQRMPERDSILREFKANRDDELRLIPEKLPILGKATFENYFEEAIGPVLYQKFMEQYTQKMWNIPGNELQTSMVWADRFNHEYSKESKVNSWIYDPIKFENHTLGKGISFQVYPKRGWNVVWNKMSANAKKVIDKIINIEVLGTNATISLESGDTIFTRDFDLVINTIDLDEFFGDRNLPYTGRLIVPLLIPDNQTVFPFGAESIHYSGAEFTTRVTEMKTITKHESPDTLLLLEIPILPGAIDYFPKNIVENAKEKNLFAEKAYPQQSIEAIQYHKQLTLISKQIKNWYNCGRHAQFKYWGMPETVKSAFDLVGSLP